MLYLEASWDTCNNHAFNPHRPAVVRAVRPSGSAAIFFTRKGRLKVRQMLASQPWHWIDLMYAAAINAGALEAYMTMPPCFMQDGYFGTEYSRASEMPAIAVAVGQAHQPVYPVCVEHYFNRPTPFNTLSFTMAHMHTRRERLIGKGGGGEGGGGGGRILSRTLAILSKDLQKAFPREHNMYATWVCLLSSFFLFPTKSSRASITITLISPWVCLVSHESPPCRSRARSFASPFPSPCTSSISSPLPPGKGVQCRFRFIYMRVHVRMFVCV